jgi:hypothetical protein
MCQNQFTMLDLGQLCGVPSCIRQIIPFAAVKVSPAVAGTNSTGKLGVGRDMALIKSR